MVASISSGPPPWPFTIKPAVRIAPKNAKLVPCTLSIPEPIGPIRLAWIKVATPETISDILIKYGIRSPNPKTPPIMRVGVMIPTMIASKCCIAA